MNDFNPEKPEYKSQQEQTVSEQESQQTVAMCF